MSPKGGGARFSLLPHPLPPTEGRTRVLSFFHFTATFLITALFGATLLQARPFFFNYL